MTDDLTPPHWNELPEQVAPAAVFPPPHCTAWEDCILSALEPAAQPDAAAIREAALIKALQNIRELNLSGADEHGHKWANSDLIAQEIVAALAVINTGKEYK